MIFYVQVQIICSDYYMPQGSREKRLTRFSKEPHAIKAERIIQKAPPNRPRCRKFPIPVPVCSFVFVFFFSSKQHTKQKKKIVWKVVEVFTLSPGNILMIFLAIPTADIILNTSSGDKSSNSRPSIKFSKIKYKHALYVLCRTIAFLLTSKYVAKLLRYVGFYT